MSSSFISNWKGAHHDQRVYEIASSLCYGLGGNVTFLFENFDREWSKSEEMALITLDIDEKKL